MRTPPPPLPFAAAQAYADQVQAWAAQPLPPGVRAWRDIAWGPHPAQVLHAYAPDRPAPPGGWPVLLFWHGGGWTNGEPDWCRFMAGPVCALGALLVTPGYRLAHEARLPAAADDAAAALRAVAAQAAAWGGNPQRLLLAGHSAGGHLAALTALRGDGHGRPHPAVQACLPISAILDLHHPAPPPGSLEERVYTTVLSRPEDDAPMSPLLWARAGRVPLALTLAQHDSERVRRSHQRLMALWPTPEPEAGPEAEPEADAPAVPTLLELPGADHFSAHTGLADPAHPWYGVLLRALRRGA